MDSAPAGDGFYLAAEHVWVPGADPQEWPLRHGYLIASPPAAEEPWLAALLVYPTWELAKRSVQRLQVSRAPFTWCTRPMSRRRTLRRSPVWRYARPAVNARSSATATSTPGSATGRRTAPAPWTVWLAHVSPAGSR